ncbi:MAG: tail fiber domain-containing protein [Candidatus Omnitrophica bacterium]|nr:tail fiber domain-containing protein [Candidatus Omnitrophota bacterium]
MKNKSRVLITCLFFLSLLPALVFCEEILTLTTYYPSPYGSYKELSAHRMKVGTTFSGKPVVDNGLIVEGSVGIGTTSPGYKLEIKQSGAVSETEYILGAFDNSVNAGGIYIGYVGDGTGASLGRLRSGSDIPLALGTAAYPEAIYIRDSDGYIGIGTTAPSSQFEVVGGARFRPGNYGKISIATPSGENGIVLFTNDINEYRADIRRGNGGLYFFTEASTAQPASLKFAIRDADNNIYAFGSWQTSWSDQYLKQDIMPQLNSLSKILSVNPITYHWKPEARLDDKLHYGVIAQELQKIFPEMVYSDNKGYLNVKRDELQFVLVGAIQEQQKQIEDLKSENQKIREALAKMKKKN